MPITRRGSDGQTYILEEGRYRPVTEAEAGELDTGPWEAFARAGLRNVDRLAQVGQMAGSVGTDLANVGYFGQQFMESERDFNVMRKMQPGATLAGELVLDPLNVPVGRMAKSMATIIGRNQASAAAQDTAQAVIRSQAIPDQATGDAVRDAVGEAVQTAGQRTRADSVGSASIMDVIPRSIREPIERTLDEVFTPGELSRQQRQALPIADEIGWEFLPGQRTGNTFASEIATSNPMVRDAFAAEMSANRSTLDGAALRALGRDGDEMGFDILADSLDDMGREFDDLIAEMTPIQFGDDAVLRTELDRLATQVADELDLDPGNIASQDLLRQLGREMEEITGETFQRLHSRWRGRSSAAFRSKDVEANEVAELYSMAVNALDDALMRSQGGTDFGKRYAAVRSQYRMAKVLERPGSLMRGGEGGGGVNPSVTWNNLRREYGRNFDRQKGNVPQEVQQFMDTVKVARAFQDTLGDSGTASRMFLQDLAGNPKAFFGNLALRELIKRRAAVANLVN